ncbi:exonuclease domain-containing protein [Alkalicoccus urumqiensis]|uniref:DNA polymerase III subunit epsilon n=1 Tax=Alkalicoccus urumqiensis TaxID=1548213 RepID=A0A2P6MKY5_ALKUR|nr:exonuclease domain-containing protein [Alkalicoccus urumqiensis]PRO66948.1 DNA polymerase III subunit epsilon [Alkalicoccus urumqiensis]
MNVVDRWMKQLGSLAGRGTYDTKGSRDPKTIAYARRLQRAEKRQKHLDLPLEDVPVVVFDLETTGFAPRKGDTILSIGAVKKTGEEFYSPVYSESPVPEEVRTLTGITEEELKEAPPAEQVLTDFLSFIQGTTLVAHHAAHERAFMDHSLWTLFRMKFEHRLLDTSFLTHFIPETKGVHSLDDCLDQLNLPRGTRHHALNDAKMTMHLWECGLDKVKQEGIYTMRELYQRVAAEKH